MTDKQKKALKKKLQKEADKLWHIACLKKWGNKCFFIDSEKKAHGHNDITDSCHHFKPKGIYSSLRYNVDNGVPVCWTCHNKLEQHDKSMQNDILKKRGSEWNDNLESTFRSHKRHSFQTIPYYEEEIKKLQNYIDMEN